jgi:predicted amidophosphoribosyltransferase
MHIPLNERLDESDEVAMTSTLPAIRLALPFSNRLVDALFPPACPACRGETATGQTLCQTCWAETSFLSDNGCVACGREIPGLGATDAGFRCDTCQTYPPVWDRGAAVLAYEGAGRRLVLGLKHGDRLDMLPMLGGWMLRAGRGLIAEADLVIPAPMHWTRRLRRRFNQSAELARTVCLAADRSDAFAPDLLRRTRRTGSQDGRDRSARADNLRGCIGMVGGNNTLAGRRVLLIDDVLTTGATMNAVAEVCRAAGASTVDTLVLALVSFDEAPYLRNA